MRKTLDSNDSINNSDNWKIGLKSIGRRACAAWYLRYQMVHLQARKRRRARSSSAGLITEEAPEDAAETTEYNPLSAARVTHFY